MSRKRAALEPLWSGLRGQPATQHPAAPSRRALSCAPCQSGNDCVTLIRNGVPFMTRTFDPILTEVIRHELISASEEMNITMKQTTRSIVAKEGGDYSAGLLDPDGRVIAQAVPYGLGYFTAVMPHIL